MDDIDSSDEEDDFSDSQLLSGESTAESGFTSDDSAVEPALESQHHQQQQQQQAESPSEQFQHPETADAAAVAGHPHDADSASIGSSTTQQQPQQASHSHGSEPRLDTSPGSPHPITLDVAKVNALTLAKVNGGDPTILNAGLPHDYRRSPTQSKVVSSRSVTSDHDISQCTAVAMSLRVLTCPDHVDAYNVDYE